MRVLDVAAGGGYTSQLLALAVGPTGKVWAQHANPGAALKERAANPKAGITVVARPFDDPVPPKATSLDLVTLILNYHDLSYLPVDRDAMNRKIFAALKPGEAFHLVNDHDPKPLYYQFKAEHDGAFGWTYLESGPEVWRVEIRRAA